VRQLVQPLNGNLSVFRPFGGGGHVFRLEMRNALAPHFRRTPPTSALHDFHAALRPEGYCPIARLHHFSPFSLPSLVAHIDFQALRLVG